MKKVNILLAFLLILLGIFVTQCSKNISGDLPDVKPSFVLKDGTKISRGDSDDYSPVLLTRADKYLVLLFASNRSGSHNIYATKSVTAYTGVGPFPAFEALQIVKDVTGTSLNATDRVSLSAFYDNSTTSVTGFFTNPSTGAIQYLTDIAVSNGVSSSSVTSLGSFSGKVNGILSTVDAGTVSHKLIVINSTDYKVNLIDVSDPTSPVAGNTYSVDFLNEKSSIAVLNPQDQTILFSAWKDNGECCGEVFVSRNGVKLGVLAALNRVMFEQGLKPAYINTMFKLGEPMFSRMVFSAGTSYTANQNIYAIASHALPQFIELIAPEGPVQGGYSNPTIPDGPNLTMGLIAFYPMNAPSPQINVVPGAAFPLTGTSTNISNRNSQADKAQAFNGSNDELVTTQIIPANSSFTVSAWVKETGIGGILFGNGTDGINTQVQVVIGSGGYPSCRFGSTSSETITGATSINSSWGHITCTYDSTTDKLNLYINGVSDATEVSTTSDFIGTGGGATIGSKSGGGYLTGDLDEVRVYNRALNATEVAALFALPQ